jgi:hypothetical protein
MIFLFLFLFYYLALILYFQIVLHLYVVIYLNLCLLTTNYLMSGLLLSYIKNILNSILYLLIFNKTNLFIFIFTFPTFNTILLTLNRINLIIFKI